MENQKPNKHYRDDDRLRKIGEKIRFCRNEKGLTQAELAQECGDKDWSQISRMERGLVNFTVSYLFLLAKILDVPAAKFLEE
ncbi:helix-turn-helix domain-containing protein [Dyadobacter koreensis]|uniref:helix-turn-helix domain-containing protein n=1 Tax=Dyadobacter koreensis TaxID=408657 RepID=UPI000B825D94